MDKMRRIKGIKWKSDNEASVKGSFNEICESRAIYCDEQQKDGTSDKLTLYCKLNTGQYGEYSNEYLPSTLNKQGHKTIDVTAVLIDEENQKGIWYLLDLKATVAGEDVIFKLIEQWEQSYQYLKNSVLDYLKDVSFEEHMGVVTRCFDEERIRNAISSKKKMLEEPGINVQQSIAYKKKQKNNIVTEKEIECLSHFICRKIYYKDSSEERWFDFGVVLERTADEILYEAKINVEIN